MFKNIDFILCINHNLKSIMLTIEPLRLPSGNINYLIEKKEIPHVLIYHHISLSLIFIITKFNKQL